MTEYTHAKDYLLELAENKNTDGWLHDLIIRVVNNNGILSEYDLKTSAEQLEKDSPATLPMPTSVVIDNNVEVRITKLIHHSGVSALACEQKITFSPDITLLYGTNGTGKSSYFRILNEIVGGNREIQIHHNIFADNPEPFNVELHYRTNQDEIKGHHNEGKENELHWFGIERKIPPLSLASVFDTGYTADLLEKRSAGTTIVRPLGLHLFAALTNAMNGIKQMLTDEIQRLQNLPIRIPHEGLSQELRMMLIEREWHPEKKQFIEERYVMTEAQQRKLDECVMEYNTLLATDYNAKIKLVDIDLQLAEGLRDHVVTTYSKLQQLCNAVESLEVKMVKTIKKNEKAKLKIKILSEIGDTNSDEWKAFIQSGAAFTASAHLSASVCPYCRQELKGDAINIVQAYVDFLNDKSETDLHNMRYEQEQLKLQLEAFNVNTYLNERVSKVVNDFKDDVSMLLQKLQAKLDSYRIKIKEIGSWVIDEGSDDDLEVLFESVAKMLYNRIDNLKKKIKSLTKERGEKDERLRKLTERRNKMWEHRVIARQQQHWKEWIGNTERIDLLEQCKTKLNINMLNTLAKTASQQLLTDGLRAKFQEELDALSFGYLKVSLGELEANSGQSYMQIKLPGDIKTQDILSEGEQKGVALALFIAERRMERMHNPIIMDDPVNSFDHHFTSRLMERLAQLDNQIIVFSHNILLRESLIALLQVHECSANSIADCRKQSKHLFIYNVDKRASTKGLVHGNKHHDANYYLKEARHELNCDEFSEGKATSCAIQLRKAIERMVDEKVFLGLTPLRYNGGKYQRIPWAKLRKLQTDPQMIKTLQWCYNRLSSDLHLSVEQQLNPLDWNELNIIANTLEKLMG